MITGKGYIISTAVIGN